MAAAEVPAAAGARAFSVGESDGMETKGMGEYGRETRVAQKKPWGREDDDESDEDDQEEEEEEEEEHAGSAQAGMAIVITPRGS